MMCVFVPPICRNSRQQQQTSRPTPAVGHAESQTALRPGMSCDAIVALSYRQRCHEYVSGALGGSCV